MNTDDTKEFFIAKKDRPEDDGMDMRIRVWPSTYEKIIAVKAKMELALMEHVSIAQTIDALTDVVVSTKMKAVP